MVSMETEQRYKFAEDIRKILCHGHRHLEKGEPFSAQASDMAEELWALGYRPDMAESTIYHRLHQETEAAWIQLWALQCYLEAEINHVGPDDPKYAGLVSAHSAVCERLNYVAEKRDHWDDLFAEALTKEGFNE